MHSYIYFVPPTCGFTAIGNRRLSYPAVHYGHTSKNFIDLIVYSTSKITRVSNLFLLQYFGFLLLSRCISSDVIVNLSSICSSRNVYNYVTLDQFQQMVVDLTLALENLTFNIGDLCHPSVQTYMCDYFFPPCTNNNLQAICAVSCDNYLHNGVCTSYFTEILNYLNTTNSTIVRVFEKNCSASLDSLYGVDTREFGCNHLDG